MPPVEQKRRMQDLTPPATRAGQRHLMIGAVPDLGPPEGVATHWNPNGVQPAFENPSFDHRPGAQQALQPSIYYPQWRWKSNIFPQWCEKPGVCHEEFGDVSPITPQYATFNQSRGGGNIAPNSNGFTGEQQAQNPASQHEATLAALQGGQQQDSSNNTAPQPSSMKFRPKSVKDRQRLSLQTQIPPPPPVPEEEEGEAMDEIIAMSPAARQPITSFRKSRSSIALSMVSAGPGNSNSQVNLSGVNLAADTQKPYFGQTINSADLIATGIENAFSRL
ncbi:hypothetical protein KC343_g11858 [Hortaea werneckii]|nr:hypothetical protein KC323_g1895 [Hortaea werneckii]KAI6875096.1 hypothetical protein KC338_g965 [Hortaea werneckii]KAI7161758.1 hypothetical protein KC352_g26749 [Hortaea werneckii]KAI7357550.1 hypothetical protein KC320_g1662 [Hortaea werneckii]KAI7549945.1 hypothetical protein KC317_g14423 [Hortaea werneckii]